MIAIGYDSKGVKREFDCTSILSCYREDLVSLEVPYGVRYISCENNSLVSLVLPKRVIALNCMNNCLKELELSVGIEDIKCFNNYLDSLFIAEPSMVKILYCDKEVSGLASLIGKPNIILL